MVALFVVYKTPRDLDWIPAANIEWTHTMPALKQRYLLHTPSTQRKEGWVSTVPHRRGYLNSTGEPGQTHTDTQPRQLAHRLNSYHKHILKEHTHAHAGPGMAPCRQIKNSDVELYHRSNNSLSSVGNLQWHPSLSAHHHSVFLMPQNMWWCFCLK